MSTEVTIQLDNTRPLYRKLVRDGVNGNYDVVREMIRLIRNGISYDKGVEVIAKNILINKHLDSFSPAEDQLAAIVNFVKDNVKYIQDIAGRIESLKSARQTLSDKWGDCDDHAVLNATLAGDLGFEDIRIAMAKYSPSDTTFGHVYCVVYSNGHRYALDTSLPDAKLGREVKAYEIREIEVFKEVPGLDGFSAIYNNLRHHVKDAVNFTVKAIPGALNVLPLGFAASTAIATGTSLVEQANDKSYSLSTTASHINAELDKIILDLLQSKIALDLAKNQAVQLAAQLAAIEVQDKDRYTLSVVGATIKQKLAFISNFKKYAIANNIRLVYLDPKLMLATGVGLAGLTGAWLYRNYKNNRRS